MNNKTAVVILTLGILAATPVVAMDRVRTETRTDLAVSTFGLSGQGVTIVILDRGIDYTHLDFRNTDGTTRIKWLLDMSNQSNWCQAGNPPPIEYTEAQINAALTGGPAVNSTDNVGHGTVTAGLAAGNGSAFANGKYRGIAPEADLLIVKYTSEGAPAHDGIPGETGFVACFDEALDWVDSKIDALGQPAVALANFGTQFGPMDGTSALSRKINTVFPDNLPGRIWVEGTGDEGDLDNHAGGDFSNTVDTVIPFEITQSSFHVPSLWYDGNLPAQITVTLNNGAVVGPLVRGGSGSNGPLTVFHYVPGTEFYPWLSTSGDSSAWIGINGYVGGGEIRIRALGPGTGRVDAYGPFSTAFEFTDMLVPGRLADIGTTGNAIILGAYVNKTEYVDIDGIPRVIVNDGDVDDIWPGSSGGPTRDGRMPGVDVMTPGNQVFAAYGVNSYFGTFRFNLIEDGGGFYGRQGAVSGAAPILQGAVALLLEMDPTLTTAEARTILRDTAVSDAFTGSTPNTLWGYGKLDVFAAAQQVAMNMGMDADQDGIENDVDNCQMVANANQRDTDADNVGNACDPDVALPNDCNVNFLDLNVYRNNFFAPGDLDTDNNGDGQTNFIDLNIVRDFFFGPPGPSAGGCN